MVGVAGFTLCFQVIQKLSSTVRTILYTGFGIITLVTIFMNLSYKGIPFVAVYGIIFIFIGFYRLPKELLKKKYNNDHMGV